MWFVFSINPYQARPLKSQGFIKHLVMAQMSTQRIIKHHTHTVCSKCSCFAICSLHSLDALWSFYSAWCGLQFALFTNDKRIVQRHNSNQNPNCVPIHQFQLFFFFLFFSICLIGRLIMKVGMHWCVFFLSSCSILAPISIWFCWMFELASFDYLQEKSFASL